jgi:alpha-tubulin suppressor-like RCC1 family protein
MSQKRRLHHMICISLSLCLLLMATRQASPALVHASSSSDGQTGSLGVLVPPASAYPSAIETLNFTAIALGADHTCALLSGGGMMCWGDNTYGQIGDGTTTNRSTPVEVIGLASGVTAISAGADHTCALLTGGGVKCWGANWFGQIGDGTYDNQRLTPVNVSGLASGAIAVSAGGTHTCALLAGGGVKCWGQNMYGQLGDGTYEYHLTPVDVSGLTSGVLAVIAGGTHTCALLTSSGVQCWGYNKYGELGNGSTANSNTPVDVSGLASGVSAVSTSGAVYTYSAHTCGLLTGGGMRCWGTNWYGALGDGTTTNRSIPVEVIGLEEGVAAISAGSSHTCALLSGGGMKCWGENWTGALGDGTTANRSTPVDVIGLASSVTAISAGGSHTCALLSDGEMNCWGENLAGELGNGIMPYRAIPVDIIGLTGGLTDIKAGYLYTCALLSGGGVKCWGANGDGQLGDSTSYFVHSTPVDVIGLNNDATAITVGWAHTCARLSDGGVKCWGYNNYGQLGDGTSESRNAPVNVIGLDSDVSAVSAGIYHTCALLSGSGVQCWGANTEGELGDGTNVNRLTPVDVSGLASGVTAITTGGVHSCALLSSGGVKCWGTNESGQLGDGTISDRNTPVNVIGLASGVSAIAGGNAHNCALLSNGGVKCWGANWEGQLGDGTTTDSSIPVEVNGLSSDVIAIAANIGHTCALLTGGGMKCWGGNGSGELGDGTTEIRTTPVDVSGMAGNVIAIAAGGAHTCALVGAGRPKCWGADSDGQLGIGKVTQWLTPVPVIERSPSLGFNYAAGQPGSFFTLTGWNFPPDAQLTLSINNQVLTTTLQVNPTGSFIVFLNTTGAEAGGYAATVSGDPGTSAAFFLIDSAPLQPQEGGGLTFLVPAGLALHNFVYLPLLKR